MYRLLFFIASLLISLSGFAQTPSDSIHEARRVQIEKAREAARAKAKARAEERAKMEAEKNRQENGVDSKGANNQGVDSGNKSETDAREERLKQARRRSQANKPSETDASKTASATKDESKTVKEDPKKEEKSRKEEKAKKVDKSKKEEKAKKEDKSKKEEEPKKEEKPKKLSIKERNMADTAVAKSKYGNGTFGLRGNVGASIVWSDYSDRDNKIGFDSWGFVLNGGLGYRIYHAAYAGILLEIEAVEMLAFSPMLDIVVAAPTPVAPFVEIAAGPYISYSEDRNWVFQPRAGLSCRGKKNKIMRFGFGLRMYDDAFDAETFKPQYAASYTVEF